VACIGCSKCEDICPENAVTMINSLAYIDPVLCTLCGKCVPVCPTHSIIETNFPSIKEEITQPEVIASAESKKLKTDA